MKLPMSILELVNDFRKRIGVDEGSPISVKDVLTKLHIFTVYRDMSLGVRGMSLKKSENQMGILVNSNLPLGKQHETIAHELYHLFYDSNPQAHIYHNQDESESERAATAFAQQLLLPDVGIQAYVADTNMSSKEEVLRLVLVLENRYRVSRELVVSYLIEHDLCNEETISFIKNDDCRASSEKFGYGSKLYEPGNTNQVIGDYEEMAKKLLDSGSISIGHYNELITQLKENK